MDFALNVYFDMALGVEVTEKIGDFVFEVGTTCSHLAARRHVLRYLHAGETIILCGGCALDGQ